MGMPGFGMSLCLSFSASSDRFGRLGTSRGARGLAVCWGLACTVFRCRPGIIVHRSVLSIDLGLPSFERGVVYGLLRAVLLSVT